MVVPMQFDIVLQSDADDEIISNQLFHMIKFCRILTCLSYFLLQNLEFLLTCFVPFLSKRFQTSYRPENT